MEKEFKLSDRIWPTDDGVVNVEDVKVKRLKEERPMKYSMDEWTDKLAGEL